ncbi:MAG: hypothetical protein JW797_00875 [Bradymonadales bacterium]|nr:hypothetical protein [Bradymonadales bacterium]
MKPGTLLAIASLHLLVGLQVAACQWSSTTISGVIRMAVEVAPEEEAAILLLIADDVRHPSTPSACGDAGEEPWSPSDLAFSVVVPSGRMNGETATYASLRYQPGVAEYFYWHSESQYTATRVCIGAFVDRDDNGQLDPGEPWGVYPDNPLVDLVDDTSNQAPNQADIPIDRIWEE